MREIKFRAWIFTGFDEGIKPFMANVDHIKFENYAICTDEDNNEWFIEKECNLMQYTGLKDKNKKEIYEGDIVIVTYKYSLSNPKPTHKGVIVWSDENACFDIKYVYNAEGFSTKEFEVIGNIYENPELLKEV